MTIDGRLDRLTERHEVLTQSLELTRIQQAEDAENIRKLARIAETTLDSIKRLEAIVTSHETRITTSKMSNPESQP